MTLEAAIELDWFSPVDLKANGIDDLSKVELLNLIAALNKKMEESTEYWDGG